MQTDTSDKQQGPDNAHWLARFEASLLDRLLAGTEGLTDSESIRIAMTRGASLIGVVGFAIYSTAHALADQWVLALVCTCTMVLMAVNLLAYGRHRNIDIVVHVLAAAFLVEEFLSVAVSGNMAEALPMWGIVPVGVALLCRSVAQVVMWGVIYAIGCAGQLVVADPELFSLSHPMLVLFVGLGVYGMLGASYHAIRSRCRRRYAEAQAEASALETLMPICSWCKQVRDDDGYWLGVETYLVERQHELGDFAPGLCPECAAKQGQAITPLPSAKEADPADQIDEGQPSRPLQRLQAGISTWFASGPEEADASDLWRLTILRVATVLVIIGHSVYIMTSMAEGYYGLMISHGSTIAAVVLNLAFLRWHRRIEMAVFVFAGIMIGKATVEVALTSNVGDQVAWWGLVPLTFSLMLRDGRYFAGCMVLTAMARVVQVQLSDPALVELHNANGTVVIAGFLYGSIALAYQRTVERDEREAQQAEGNTNQLRRLLPVCTSCKQVRDDEGYWHQVESYLGNRSGTALTHGICPTCLAKVTEEMENAESAQAS